MCFQQIPRHTDYNLTLTYPDYKGVTFCPILVDNSNVIYRKADNQIVEPACGTERFWESEGKRSSPLRVPKFTLSSSFSMQLLLTCQSVVHFSTKI